MTTGRTESPAAPERGEDLSTADRAAHQRDATRQTDDQPASAVADDESDPEDPNSPPRFP